jgi:5-methylcytosine-specific restriction endonuclease McrA
VDTLVLSPAYEPINQITWQEAVVALFGPRGDNIEVVETYEDRDIRSVTFSIKMPAVIRYISGRCIKKRGVRFSRENVYTRDKGRCQYCNLAVKRPEATYDHVVPRTLGGQTRWENIVIACVDCNQRKGGRTPDQARMRLVATPVRPKHLPETLRLTFTRATVPMPWRQWLRNVAYWHDELEQD